MPKDVHWMVRVREIIVSYRLDVTIYSIGYLIGLLKVDVEIKRLFEEVVANRGLDRENSIDTFFTQCFPVKYKKLKELLDIEWARQQLLDNLEADPTDLDSVPLLPTKEEQPNPEKEEEPDPEPTSLNALPGLQLLQREIGQWAMANFGHNESKRKKTPEESDYQHKAPLGSLAPLLGMMEELGELVHAVLKRHQGIRGFDSYEKYKTYRDDALGDILVYMCDFASREGVDLLATLNEVWSKVVAKRDWKENPEEGNVEEGKEVLHYMLNDNEPRRK